MQITPRAAAFVIKKRHFEQAPRVGRLTSSFLRVYMLPARHSGQQKNVIQGHLENCEVPDLSRIKSRIQTSECSSSMVLRDFGSESQRAAKLKAKKPLLEQLSTSIPWESFRPLLDQGYAQERKSNAGRKRIDPLILFKMLILQQLFNLSDGELEFQVNDRRSFEKFVGLDVTSKVPDATTVAFFRERLRKAGVIEETFEMFERFLRDQGFKAQGGQIIDATLISVPK